MPCKSSTVWVSKMFFAPVVWAACWAWESWRTAEVEQRDLWKILGECEHSWRRSIADAIGGSVCGRRKWKGSVRSRWPRPISVRLLSLSSPHEVRHGNNTRPLRARRVRTRRETLHRSRRGRDVLRSQQIICKVATYPSRSADKQPDSGSAERTIPLRHSKGENTTSMSAGTYRRRLGLSKILAKSVVSPGRIEGIPR